MSPLKYQPFTFKSTITIILILGTLLLIVLFSLQLQNKTAMSYQSKAFEFQPINIAMPTIPTINTNISLPTIPPINIQIPHSIPNVQISTNNIGLPGEIPSSISINSAPMIGTVVSQGASIIQKILASPDAKNIIAMFLRSILSAPQSSSTDSSQDVSPEPSIVNQVPSPTIPPEPTGNPQPSGNQQSQNPTPAAVKGKCHLLPGNAGASRCGLTAKDVVVSNNYSGCTGCPPLGVLSPKGKGKCSCPDGKICTCQLTDSMEQTVSCTNGGKWEQVECK